MAVTMPPVTVPPPYGERFVIFSMYLGTRSSWQDTVQDSQQDISGSVENLSGFPKSSD